MDYILFYLMVCAMSTLLIWNLQKTKKNHLLRKFQTVITRKKKIEIIRIDKFYVKYVLSFLLAMLPIIVLYGLRYGIGTDYFAYEDSFRMLHDCPIETYWKLNQAGVPGYYEEFGFFLLYKIAPSYAVLNFIVIIIISVLLFRSFYAYADKMSISMGVFIFFSTQFIYSMNGVRFILAVAFCLYAYTFAERGKPVKFIILIFLATFFHKSAAACIVFYFLRYFDSRIWNRIRNIIFALATISFPVVMPILFEYAVSIPFFTRYLTTDFYAIGNLDGMGGNTTWFFHIFPIIIPVLVLLVKHKVESNRLIYTFTLFVLAEIPLRMLGFYNPWFGRIVRFLQISECLLIPLVLWSIKGRKTKMFMYAYYVVWYTFYFVYYEIAVDNFHSIPYVTIFH